MTGETATRPGVPTPRTDPALQALLRTDHAATLGRGKGPGPELPRCENPVCGSRAYVYARLCDDVLLCADDREAHEASCPACIQIQREDAAADLAEDDEIGAL